MSKTVNLGGDRLGSGNKMNVNLHGFNRSNHDLSYAWRSTMAPGTLVPFMVEPILNGDTFDIDVNSLVRTLPMNGPIFGSFKLQMDVFSCPIRLYNRALHNNKLKIGLDMSQVKFPIMTMIGDNPNLKIGTQLNQQQINSSSLLAYLGTRGLGKSSDGSTTVTRNINAMPVLMYWDIYKNYYANKQEEIGAAITVAGGTGTGAISLGFTIDGSGGNIIPPEINAATTEGYLLKPNAEYDFTFANATGQGINDLMNNMQICVSETTSSTNLPSDTSSWNWMTIKEWIDTYYTTYAVSITTLPSGYIRLRLRLQAITDTTKIPWGIYRTTDVNSGNTNPGGGEPYAIVRNGEAEAQTFGLQVDTFPLSNIDNMRENILGASTSTPYIINTGSTPYSYTYGIISGVGTGTKTGSYYEMGGLGLKTYQSDRFNNWLDTEWIDGANGIAAVTAVDTSSGSFTMDTLNLSQKVYDMLNRIAVSGGSYTDWQEAVYGQNVARMAETPIYVGGASSEIVFNEVVSTAQTEDELATTPSQKSQLGGLGGRGSDSKQKGGTIRVKCNEPSYVIGIVSITPRVDYSQGNKWWTRLETMDDLHKPNLDAIGFQELITDEMAAWDTTVENSTPTYKSAGKQPAWIQYMTNVNQCYGNFAVNNAEMFMTLNRRYEYDDNGNIADLTTYIDPSKFNYAFAVQELKAQNFWVQLGVGIHARRVMSQKVIPNL